MAASLTSSESSGRISAARPFDRNSEYLRDLYRLVAQGEGVEKNVDILGRASLLEGKLYGLGSGHDEVFRGRPESVEKFRSSRR